MSADQRVELARRFLAEARQRSVERMPPTLLMREVAELRRLLASVLAVIDGQAVTLTLDQLATVLAALDDAAWWRGQQARPDMAVTYRAVASELGGQR